MTSDSESEYEESIENSDTLHSTTLKRAIKDCLEMTPGSNTQNPTAAERARSMLLNLRNPKNEKSSNVLLRSSAKGDDRKKVEDSFREVSQDLIGINRKLNGIMDCVLGILDRMDALEERMNILENTSNEKGAPSSYSEVLVSNLEEGNKRLEKLEYLGSEEERKKRTLEVSLSHPQLDSSNSDLGSSVKNFLSQKLKMANREIDANMLVQKTRRNNCVILTLSDKRYKLFLFHAKKSLRQSNDEVCDDLFICDNLTSYNYKMMKTLKQRRRDKNAKLEEIFEVVYSIDGKIFVKIRKSDENKDSVHIKTPKDIDNLLERFA